VTYTGDTIVTVAFETKSVFESYRLVLYDFIWFDPNFEGATGRDLILSTPLVASPKVLTPDDYTNFTLQVHPDGSTAYGTPLDKGYFQTNVFQARIIGIKTGGGGVVSCKAGVKRNDNGIVDNTTTCSSGVGITCSCAVAAENDFYGKVVSDPFQAFVKASAPSEVGICDILDQTVDSTCALKWGTQQIDSGNLCRRSIVAPVVSAGHVCGCVLVLPFDVFCTLTF
jgi:hypothetical protein